jgi:hypothetical protein
MLTKLARKPITAFNLVGSIKNTELAIYDITEFLFHDNRSYIITRDPNMFKNECNRQTYSNIILNVTTNTDYNNLNELTKYTGSQNMQLCHMLVFPKKPIHYINDDNRFYRCHNIFFAEYYLSEIYDKRKHFFNNIIKNNSI